MNISPEMIENIELGIKAFNYSILVGLLLALLIGFMRGTIRSSVRFLTRIGPLVVLLIFVDLLSSTILNFKFDQFISLSQGSSIMEIVTHYMSKSLNNGVAIEKGSEIYKLVLACGLGISRIIVFFIGMFICGFIITPLLNLIVKIITRAVFGSKQKRKERFGKKGIFSRFLGMGINGLNYVIVFLICTLPLFGPLSLVSELKDEMIEISLMSEQRGEIVNLSEEELQIEEIFEMLEKFETITLRKYLNKLGPGGKPLDAFYFGYLTRIKTDNGTINIADLVDDAKEVLSIINTYKKDGEIDVLEILANENEVETLLNIIKKRNILAIFAPAAVEILDANELLTGSNIDIMALKTIDWKEENDAIATIAGKVATLIFTLEMDFNDPVKVLSNPKLDDLVGELAGSLAESQLVKNIGLELLYEYIDEMVASLEEKEGKDLSVLIELLDFRKMTASQWENDFKTISNIARALYEMGLFEEEGNMDFTKSEAMKRLITKPFMLTKIQGREAQLINTLFEITELNKALEEMNFDLNLENIDWQTEPEKIANVIVALANMADLNNFNFEVIMASLENPKERKKAEILVDAIGESEIFKSALKTIVEKLISEPGLEELIDASKVDFDDVNWDTEPRKILNVMFAILDLGSLEEFGFEKIEEILKDDDKDKVIALIDALNDSQIFKPVIRSFIEMLIEQSGFGELFDLSSTDFDEIDWDTEPEKIVNVLIALADIGDLSNFDFNTIIDSFDTKEGRANARALVDAINESEIFKPALRGLVEKLISEPGLGDLIDVDNVDYDSVDWDTEPYKVLNVMFAFMDLGSIDNFGIKQIEDVLKTDDGKEKLITLINALHDSQIFNPVLQNFVELIFTQSGLEDLIDKDSISYDEINWAEESENFVDVIVAFLEFGSLNEFGYNKITDALTDENKKDKVTNLFNALNKSQIFKPVVRSLVETMIEQSGFDGLVDISSIDFDSLNWINEFEAIDNIKSQSDLLEGGIEKLPRSDIVNLMKTTSKGQIASQVIGAILNDSLSLLFGVHNPSEDGKPVFDFTKPSVLAENADDMGALIDFGNKLKDLFADPVGSNHESRIGVADAIIVFDSGESDQPTLIDYYLPAIMSYAGKDGVITTDGLATSGYTYTDEGEALKRFFIAIDSNQSDLIDAKDNLENYSYLAKQIANEFYS